MAEGTILSFDMQTLVALGIQLLNVALLMTVLIWVLYRPVLRFMKNRETGIAEDLSQARVTGQEAAELLQKYQQQLDELNKERDQILADARAAARTSGDKILEAARRQGEEILERARTQAQLELEQSHDRIQTEIIDLSTLVAGKYLSISLSEQKKQELVEQALQEVKAGVS